MSTQPDFNRPSALMAQFLPPLLCLLPMLSRNDTMLYLGALVSLLVILVSLVSIVMRLSRPKARRGRLLRAALAIALACLALAHFHSERQLAMLRMNALAAGLQVHCRNYGGCPLKIEGWPAGDAPYASALDDKLGRVAHRYLYSADRDGFELRLDLGGGFAEIVSGGRANKLRQAGSIPSIRR